MTMTSSIEWRKEIWESYSPTKWLFKWYELIYVVWDEKDVVDLRINHDKDKVYLYPIIISKENNKALFISMLNKVNELYEKPEFYNTILDNCTVALWKHVKAIWSNKIWLNLWLLLPWISDEYLFEKWLINTSAKNIEDLRRTHMINALWEKYEDDEDFSFRIREDLK